jgi:hypothetical protein
MADDYEGGPLQPLSPRKPPVAEVRQVVAVAPVHLTARGVPRGHLVRFYTHTLGLRRVSEAAPGLLAFRHERQNVLLSPDFEAGRLLLAVTSFSQLCRRLTDERVAFEVLRTDTGLSREALVKDPAGNLIHLMETRAF